MHVAIFLLFYNPSILFRIALLDTWIVFDGGQARLIERVCNRVCDFRANIGISFILCSSIAISTIVLESRDDWISDEWVGEQGTVRINSSMVCAFEASDVFHRRILNSTHQLLLINLAWLKVFHTVEHEDLIALVTRIVLVSWLIVDHRWTNLNAKVQPLLWISLLGDIQAR